MKKVTDIKQTPCPMTDAMNVIGGKWKLLLVYYLKDGKLRFSELRRHLPVITTKMLTQQLRELEAASVVKRTIYPVVPPKVEYELTPLGQKLLPIIERLNAWGKLLVA